MSLTQISNFVSLSAKVQSSEETNKNLNGLGELLRLTRDVSLVILTLEASAKQDLHICKYFLQSRQIFSWFIVAFKNKRVRHEQLTREPIQGSFRKIYKKNQWCNVFVKVIVTKPFEV